jgi:hypothetical protein
MDQNRLVPRQESCRGIRILLKRKDGFSENSTFDTDCRPVWNRLVGTGVQKRTVSMWRDE